MIVFVKVSPRRYLTLDCPEQTQGWRATSRPDKSIPLNTGYTYCTAQILAGPADWTTCEIAAMRHEQKQGRLKTAVEYEAEHPSLASRIDYTRTMREGA